MSIADRLRSERERLGQTQEAFAAAAGAGKRTVIGWEQGRSAPDATALSALAKEGLDVAYVVTGERSTDIDLTLLGMCESALRRAYEESHPASQVSSPIRLSALVKVYNAVRIRMSRRMDTANAVQESAAEYLAWVTDPADDALAERAIFRLTEAKNIAAGSQHAEGGSIAAGRDVTVGSSTKLRK
ncbi:MAG: helix-turn-helix transcriptional regulator [Pseudomonadota bacterium]